MLEEPENGLTPGAIRVLYRRVLESVGPDRHSPVRQVLMSSHSPFVLVEAWNGAERDFIYQMKQSAGRSSVTPMKELLEPYKNTMLQSDGRISVRFADMVMSHAY